jgi:hypothetical protein
VTLLFLLLLVSLLDFLNQLIIVKLNILLICKKVFFILVELILVNLLFLRIDLLVPLLNDRDNFLDLFGIGLGLDRFFLEVLDCLEYLYILL